jgi:hypothetical protein
MSPWYASASPFVVAEVFGRDRQGFPSARKASDCTGWRSRPPWTASEHSICPVARTCILGEGAKHRDELAQFQSNLLTKNTDLTEQIHTLSQTMSTLTQEVHEATCKGDTSPG